MGTKKLYARLRALAGSGRKVRLTRARPSEPLKNGFVLAASPEWTAMAHFHDFYPEGYAVVRTDDITAVRSGKYERLWERMFRAEGIAVEAEPLRGLPLDRLPALLAALAAREEIVIVRREDSERDIEDFYIGRVLKVGARFVSFANFDALGRWDSKPVKIPMDDITQLELQAPYAQKFSRYLKGPCPHA